MTSPERSASPFRPRRGSRSYVHRDGDTYIYRRAVPAAFRDAVGKREWRILLEGRSAAERESEAGRHADRHNRLLAELVTGIEREWTWREAHPARGTTVAVRVEGNWQEAPAVLAVTEEDSATRDLLEAARPNATILGNAEFNAQVALREVHAAAARAPEGDAREYAEWRAERATRAYDAAHPPARPRSPTLNSLLPVWRQYRNQPQDTWKKHVQYVGEFTNLHGDLALREIAKRHVIDYVDHALTLHGPIKGRLSPGSIQKRLDSIKAALSFAVKRDLIPHNPADGVEAPDDDRPPGQKHWKAFTKADIRKLLAVSDAIWTMCRPSRRIHRLQDLQTALRALIWTGARPEEICQLRVSVLDLAAGVIHITRDESEDDDGEANAPKPKQTKNDASVRAVPIHPRLLPTLVAHKSSLWALSTNSPLLFPSFEPKATPAEIAEAKRTGRPVEIKGRYSRPISREWTVNLRSKVTTDPRKVLYSMRHAWTGESRVTGMPEHVRRALLGHASDNPHTVGYGHNVDWTAEKLRHSKKMNCVGTLEPSE